MGNDLQLQLKEVLNQQNNMHEDRKLEHEEVLDGSKVQMKGGVWIFEFLSLSKKKIPKEDAKRQKEFDDGLLKADLAKIEAHNKRVMDKMRAEHEKKIADSNRQAQIDSANLSKEAKEDERRHALSKLQRQECHKKAQNEAIKRDEFKYARMIHDHQKERESHLQQQNANEKQSQIDHYRAFMDLKLQGEARERHSQAVAVEAEARVHDRELIHAEKMEENSREKTGYDIKINEQKAKNISLWQKNTAEVVVKNRELKAQRRHFYQQKKNNVEQTVVIEEIDD